MTKDEALKLAIGKIKSARDCHFAAIDPLLFEAEEILEQALAAPAMQEPAFKVGNLVTLTGGDYPGLGQWFVQLWDGDEVAARVYGDDREAINRRIAALNTPPAQPAPVQEPVATKLETQQFNCFHVSAEDFQRLKELPVGTKLYTDPPAAQRQWTGLTDEEQSLLWEISRAALPRYATFYRLIEAKLKEKNT